MSPFISAVLGLTLTSMVTAEIASSTKDTPISSWHFYYDTTQLHANQTAFCTDPSRPQFEVKGHQLNVTSGNGLLGAGKPEDTEVDIGPFKFVTEDEYVAEIWSVGFFVVVILVVWRFFRLAFLLVGAERIEVVGGDEEREEHTG